MFARILRSLAPAAIFFAAAFPLTALVLVPSSCGRGESASESVVNWEIFQSGTPEQVKAEIAKLPEDSGLETRTEKGWNGMTPLMMAARFGSSLEVITALLKAGAKVEARSENGTTPLMYAARYNSSPEVITALLKAGADAKAKDEGGETALDYAKENDKIYKTKAYWELNDAFYKQD